jgi:hypothetical protein
LRPAERNLRAGATLAKATTELRGGEAEAAQPVEQRLIGIRRLDNAGEAVDADAVACHAIPHPGQNGVIGFNSLAEIETLAN